LRRQPADAQAVRRGEVGRFPAAKPAAVEAIEVERVRIVRPLSEEDIEETEVVRGEDRVAYAAPQLPPVSDPTATY